LNIQTPNSFGGKEENNMPFWRNYYHLVWATKNRQPLIQPDIEARLYDYLVRKAAELDVFVYVINGWTDHTHIVGAIPPKQAVADVVKRLKGASSHYLNHTLRHEEWFQWQRGYGVLTIGEQQKEKAVAYVRNQKEHHGQQTTNSWLEKVNEFDEGPPDMAEGTSQPFIIKEVSAIYRPENEDPFPF
jgi:REP element-mobilizing transposase RayT